MSLLARLFRTAARLRDRRNGDGHEPDVDQGQVDDEALNSSHFTDVNYETRDED